jgi:glucose/arabinose dehydrogenase
MVLLKHSSLAIVFAVIFGASYASAADVDLEMGKGVYEEYCSACHGEDLQGGHGGGFLDRIWKYGARRNLIALNTRLGIIGTQMPGYSEVLSKAGIESVTDFILDEEAKSEAKRPDPPELLTTDEYEIGVQVVAKGLDTPWSIAFIDERQALITEKNGSLRLMVDGNLRPDAIQNTPQVLDRSEGGLMDVAIDPEYEKSGWIYLSYTHGLNLSAGEKEPAPAMTRIVRGRIKEGRWVDEQVLFKSPLEHYRKFSNHHGSRIVFDENNYLFFSIGDYSKAPDASVAQDISLPNGKIHRINRDGSIPDDNPFVNIPNAVPSIYAYGLRNPQGLAFHPITGELWASEHGPMGGDELNLISAGQNYGWPEVTHGIDYDGTIISEFTEKEGMVKPNHVWIVSPAVCGTEFYSGALFQKWDNNLLLASLKFQDLRRLVLENGEVLKEEILFQQVGRVRDVSVGPDGSLFVVVNEPGLILRLAPVQTIPSMH